MERDSLLAPGDTVATAAISDNKYHLVNFLLSRAPLTNEMATVTNIIKWFESNDSREIYIIPK